MQRRTLTWPALFGRRKTGSVSVRLPPELLILIFRYLLDGAYARHCATYDGGILHHLPDAVYEHAVPGQVALSRAIRVCRTWYAIGWELLYDRPLVTSTANLKRFAVALHKRPDLARAVRTIVVLDSSAKQIPRLYTFGRGRKTRIRAAASRNLDSALKVCTQLDAVEALFGRPCQPLFASLEPSRLSQLGAARMRSLTMHGFWAYPSFGFRSPFSDGDFSALERLELNGLYLMDLRGFSFPALRSLVLSECSVEDAALFPPIVDTARLTELTLVRNQLWFFNEPDYGPTRASLRQHADVLEVLAIEGTAEWDVFRAIDWAAFTRMRRLSLHVGATTCVDDFEMARFPPNLQEVMILWDVPCEWRTDFYLQCDRPGLIRRLEDELLSTKGWREMRIWVHDWLLEDSYQVNRLRRLGQDRGINVDVARLECKGLAEIVSLCLPELEKSSRSSLSGPQPQCVVDWHRRRDDMSTHIEYNSRGWL